MKKLDWDDWIEAAQGDLKGQVSLAIVKTLRDAWKRGEKPEAWTQAIREHLCVADHLDQLVAYQADCDPAAPLFSVKQREAEGK